MAVAKTLITGHVLLPNGSAPASGTITPRLMPCSGSSPDAGHAERIGGAVPVTLETGGALPAAFGLVPNDAINPPYTFYAVEFLLRDANGTPYFWVERWIVDTAVSVAIGDVRRLDTAGAVPLETLLPAAKAGTVPMWNDTSVLENKYVSATPSPPFEILYRSPVVQPVRETGVVLFDKVIDLADFGHVFEQYNLQPDFVVTKLDGDGRRVATNAGRAAVAPPEGWAIREWQDHAAYPVGDLKLPGVFAHVYPMMRLRAPFGGDPLDAGESNAGFDYPSSEQFASGSDRVEPFIDFDPVYGGMVGATADEDGDFDALNRCRFVRVVIARNSNPYTDVEWAAVQTMGVHLNLCGSNQFVDEWTAEIPAGQGEVFFDETLDLRRYGLDSSPEHGALVVDFLRGSERIRGNPIDAGGARWRPVTRGEAYDPPAYPVIFDFRGVVDTPTGDYEWNTNNTAEISDLSIYCAPTGRSGTPDISEYDRDSWTMPIAGVAYCTGEIRSKIRLRAWRPARNGPAQYTAEPNGPLVDVPPGAKDGCTLRVRLFRAGFRKRGMYPFQFTSMHGSGAVDDPFRLESAITAIAPAAQTDAAAQVAAAVATLRRERDGRWFSQKITASGAPEVIVIPAGDGVENEYAQPTTRADLQYLPPGAGFAPTFEWTPGYGGDPTLTINGVAAGTVYTVRMWW